MPTVPGTAPKRETLNLRVKPEERDLIDRAARATGKNRTEFILDATRHAAVEALFSQTLLQVGAEAFDAFRTRLDAPPESNERLRKTMQSVPPWERE